MASTYSNSRIMCDQVLHEGIVAANGQFIVEDGKQEIFETIPHIAGGIARGEIELIGTDNPDADPESPAKGLSLGAATKIAEGEYRIKGSNLRKALKDGDIPGYFGSRNYDIPEKALREGLDRMTSASLQPAEPSELEVDPVTEPATDESPTEPIIEDEE